MKSNWIDRFTEKRRRLLFLRQRTATHVATQVRALRAARGWSQDDLARESGILQSTISRCEHVSYGKQTLSTLLRLAEFFDVGLDVSFVSFGELWRRETKLASERLAPMSFDEEKKAVEERRDAQVVELATGKPVVITAPRYTRPRKVAAQGYTRSRRVAAQEQLSLPLSDTATTTTDLSEVTSAGTSYAAAS